MRRRHECRRASATTPSRRRRLSRRRRHADAAGSCRRKPLAAPSRRHICRHARQRLNTPPMLLRRRVTRNSRAATLPPDSAAAAASCRQPAAATQCSLTTPRRPSLRPPIPAPPMPLRRLNATALMPAPPPRHIECLVLPPPLCCHAAPLRPLISSIAADATLSRRAGDEYFAAATPGHRQPRQLSRQPPPRRQRRCRHAATPRHYS